MIVRCLRALLVAIAFGACAQPDTVTQLCQRAQECNDLPVGHSMQDCIDVENRCTGQLTSSQRSDWERMVDGCLQDNTCSLFGSCFENVPWC